MNLLTFFEFISLISFALIIVSVVKTSKYYGISIFKTNFTSLLPFMHKTSQGKKWAYIYWLSVISASMSLLMLFYLAPKD